MFTSIEGCIGTGKTTLARLLSTRYACTSLLEETGKHPFIADFYLDPVGYAFQTELNFVLIHYHQLQVARREGVFNHLVFSDFIFDKDRLFAELTLEDPQEQRLFRETYELLKQRVPSPDLLICLRAPTEFLFERIKRRGRQFESTISFEYLNRVNMKYDEFFDSYDQSEKIILNAPDLHVVEGGAALDKALTERVIPLVDRAINRRHSP